MCDNPSKEGVHDAAGTGSAERLQGSALRLETHDEIRAAFEKAFDYRGDVTLTLRDGEKIDGYIFDRRAPDGPISHCVARVLLKGGGARRTVSYGDVVSLEFSGRDMAEGKNFAAWLMRYREKKAAGETGIRLEPEPL